MEKRSEKTALLRIPPLSFTLPAAACAILVTPAGSAWAVQTHGGAEGLVSHELGHMLFFSGALYLLVRSWMNRWSGSGWSEFKVFLGCTLVWNAVTFLGHLLDQAVEPAQFIYHHGRITSFRVETAADALYYLTRLDHLLLLPAMVALLFALRKWAGGRRERP